MDMKIIRSRCRTEGNESRGIKSYEVYGWVICLRIGDSWRVKDFSGGYSFGRDVRKSLELCEMPVGYRTKCEAQRAYDTKWSI
jgi:hypothetical protein